MSNFITQFPFINFYTELLFISTLAEGPAAKRELNKAEAMLLGAVMLVHEFHI